MYRTPAMNMGNCCLDFVVAEFDASVGELYTVLDEYHRKDSATVKIPTFWISALRHGHPLDRSKSTRSNMIDALLLARSKAAATVALADSE